MNSIDVLNYISTIEEDIIIDAHIDELREWGYGSILHVHDLHQLFWELTHRGIILDKLFRVAVVECIDEESLYTKFLGMAKHYNGWAQRQVNNAAKGQKDLRKELAEKDSVIEMVRNNYREAQEKIGKLNNEIKALKLAARPKSEGEQVCLLRHELRKEYNIKLMEKRHQDKPTKKVGRSFLEQIKTPASRIFESFDLTKEEDVKEYIGWFRLGEKKVNAATIRAIEDRYGDDKLFIFKQLVSQYNAEWEACHQGETVEENSK